MSVSEHDTAEIAGRNDRFRICCLTPLITPGVQALDDLEGLIRAVRHFDGFTSDCDPWGEHDFGSLEWQGARVYWKIDYYDQNLEYGSDPLCNDCRRVLTILLAEEY